MKTQLQLWTAAGWLLILSTAVIIFFNKGIGQPDAGHERSVHPEITDDRRKVEDSRRADRERNPSPLDPWLRRLLEGSPDSRRFALEVIVARKAIGELKAAALSEPRLLIPLAEISGRCEPATSAELAWFVLAHAGCGNPAELSATLPGLKDEALVLLLDKPLVELDGTGKQLMEDVFGSAGSNSLSRLVVLAFGADAEVSQVAINLIASIRNPELATALTHLGAPDSPPEIQSSATLALEKIQTEEQRFAVEESLDHWSPSAPAPAFEDLAEDCIFLSR